MITKLIRTLVVALVFYLVYVCAGLIIAAIAAPAITLTIIAVILILLFIGWILREFGIALP